MSEAQAEVLSGARRRIRGWKRAISAFDEGRMHLTANGVDVTSEQAQMYRSLVAQSEQLLEQFDPDGLTKDGNVEIGQVAPQVSARLFPGWFAVYRLDENGDAVDLETYELQSHASARAETRGERLGVVANDMWSIIPLD